MSDPNILLRALSADGILRLTLNDVARRNALSEAMLAQLGAAFAEAGAARAVRVIVLAANGPAFCAGHDLKELTAGRKGARPWSRLFRPSYGAVFGRDAGHCQLPQTRDCRSDGCRDRPRAANWWQAAIWR